MLRNVILYNVLNHIGEEVKAKTCFSAVLGLHINQCLFGRFAISSSFIIKECPVDSEFEAFISPPKTEELTLYSITEQAEMKKNLRCTPQHLKIKMSHGELR